MKRLALLALLTLASFNARAVTFIEDNYAKATALAKSKNVPIFVEAWTVLQRLRIPSRMLVWPEENHWILNGENSRVFYKEVDNWLRRWVTPGAQ